MPKRNNAIPQGHFRKDWDERVKTWFNQPARAQKRRKARAEKAARIWPRPLQGLLRPVVHCPTNKYNMKVRLGRGFSLEELKEAKINRNEAQSIGIAVDHRRINKSDISFGTNVQRLKEYKAKLILFPRKVGQPKKGDATEAELKTVTQLRGDVLPIKRRAPKSQSIKLDKIDTSKSVVQILKNARNEARLVNLRKRRAVKKEKEGATSAKKKDEK